MRGQFRASCENGEEHLETTRNNCQLFVPWPLSSTPETGCSHRSSSQRPKGLTHHHADSRPAVTPHSGCLSACSRGRCPCSCCPPGAVHGRRSADLSAVPPRWHRAFRQAPGRPRHIPPHPAQRQPDLSLAALLRHGPGGVAGGPGSLLRGRTTRRPYVRGVTSALADRLGADGVRLVVALDRRRASGRTGGPQADGGTASGSASQVRMPAKVPGP